MITVEEKQARLDCKPENKPLTPTKASKLAEEVKNCIKDPEMGFDVDASPTTAAGRRAADARHNLYTTTPANYAEESRKRSRYHILDMSEPNSREQSTAQPTSSDVSDVSDVSHFSLDGGMNKTRRMQHEISAPKSSLRVGASTPTSSGRSYNRLSRYTRCDRGWQQLTPDEVIDERLHQADIRKEHYSNSKRQTMEEVNLAWTKMCRKGRRVSWNEEYKDVVDVDVEIDFKRFLKISLEKSKIEIDKLRNEVLDGLRREISLKKNLLNVEEELENAKLQIRLMEEERVQLEQSHHSN